MSAVATKVVADILPDFDGIYYNKYSWVVSNSYSAKISNGGLNRLLSAGRMLQTSDIDEVQIPH